MFFDIQSHLALTQPQTSLYIGIYIYNNSIIYLVGIYIRTTGCPTNKPGSAGVYNRYLADHPNEPGMVGVYNKNLADHHNEPGSVGV